MEQEFEKLELPISEIKVCECADCKCLECGGRIVRENWTKKEGPNQYELFDKLICEKCKRMRIVSLVHIDKNTALTRAIIENPNQEDELEKYKQKTKKSRYFPKDEIDVKNLF